MGILVSGRVKFEKDLKATVALLVPTLNEVSLLNPSRVQARVIARGANTGVTQVLEANANM